MNFLFHLYLSGDDPDLLAGNLAGDFVKGRLDDRFPAGISRGIRLHRSIDSFAASSRWFRQSRLRLHPDFGLYRGVLVDLFYDHFLARDWGEHCSVMLDEYLAGAHRVVTEREAFLPDRFVRVLPIIFSELLPTYDRRDGIAHALIRMSRRLRRPNPLAEGIGELDLHYAALEEDFRAFLPEVTDHAHRFR
jgi:acyl carrier protein phosphodiesterase